VNATEPSPYTDAGNNVYLYVVGNTSAATSSTNASFPIANPLPATSSWVGGGAWDGGSSEAFVAKFNVTNPASPSLLWSTLLGGNGASDPASIAVDAIRAGILAA
jgi:hypothetical protein